MTIGADWRAPIIEYIAIAKLPSDKWEARRLKIVSARFCLIEDMLFKRSLSGPYLVCIYGDKASTIMREVNVRLCGNHYGGRALPFKFKKQGFYWPIDCVKYVVRCEKYQRYAPLIHQPNEFYAPVSALSIHEVVDHII